MILVVNFGLEVYKTQAQDNLFDDLGHPTQMAAIFELVDEAFLAIFSLELLLNVYARWMWEFLSSPWCCFDALVIAMAILAPSMTENPIPITIFRLFRALRILRLFGRLKSVRIIINALSASILPVANAFFIMFVVTSATDVRSEMKPPLLVSLALAAEIENTNNSVQHVLLP
jgi:hypothetical protein